MLALKMKGPQAKKYGQPLEAKKGKEMDSPLELLEMEPCWRAWFSPSKTPVRLLTYKSIR